MIAILPSFNVLPINAVSDFRNYCLRIKSYNRSVPSCSKDLNIDVNFFALKVFACNTSMCVNDGSTKHPPALRFFSRRLRRD